MPAHLTHGEVEVLRKYIELAADDPEGAWAPYYYEIAAVARDADVAYRHCKSLKQRGLLDCNGRAGTSLLKAPSYWPTEGAAKALEAHQ